MSFLRFRCQCLSSCERTDNFPQCQGSSLIHIYAIRHLIHVSVILLSTLQGNRFAQKAHSHFILPSWLASHVQWWLLNTLIQFGGTTFRLMFPLLYWGEAILFSAAYMDLWYDKFSESHSDILTSWGDILGRF